tara:strand:+ start:130 stop:501 length:372 start_codon:yes stop_codon:yes gene_type:complete
VIKNITRKSFDFNSLEDDVIINVNEKDKVFIQRQFSYRTDRDTKINNLEIPNNPFWLKCIIKLIRYYQKNISRKLGNRCVYDPSCSHYSELAYRKKGFLVGTKLTLNRLKRCKPKNGGIDELK